MESLGYSVGREWFVRKSFQDLRGRTQAIRLRATDILWPSGRPFISAGTVCGIEWDGALESSRLGPVFLKTVM
jgi:hypothetical protein